MKRFVTYLAAATVLLNCGMRAADAPKISQMTQTNSWVAGARMEVSVPNGSGGWVTRSIALSNLFQAFTASGINTFGGSNHFTGKTFLDVLDPNGLPLYADGVGEVKIITVGPGLDWNFSTGTLSLAPTNRFYAPLLAPSSNLTNYTLYASNSEYIINATNAVELAGLFSDASTDHVYFMGVTVTNFSGADQTLHVNLGGVRWLGSAPARITNGYMARISLQFMGDYILGAWKHEGN